jgi:hypothetical protein
MNTIEDAFRIAIEKHMSGKNRKVESSTLHPLNIVKMIKERERNEAAVVQKFSVNTEEAPGKLKNSTPGLSG